MAKHHTKDKADVGLAKVIADVTAKGYKAFVSLTEHAPFDLVIYGQGQLLRVQVKYRSIAQRDPDRILLDIRQRWSDSKKTHIKYSDKSEVDLYAVYCPNNDQCYYVWPEQFEQRLTIRLDNQEHYLAGVG